MNAITGPEKTIWRATYAFHINNGSTDDQAKNAADQKIVKMRQLSKDKSILRK